MKQNKELNFSGDSFKASLEVVKVLKNQGFVGLFAGGCVRDSIINRRPKDFDVTTNAEVEQIETFFEKTVPVGKAFGIIRVIVNNIEVEVATFRRDGEYVDGRRPVQVFKASIEEDAKRRDFTMNALFYDPIEHYVLDYCDGLADIEARVIRAVGDATQRFDEDHLRILRGLRFASELGFNVEARTLGSIKTHAHLLEKISAERVNIELTKFFNGKFCDQWLPELGETILGNLSPIKKLFGTHLVDGKSLSFEIPKLQIKNFEKTYLENSFGFECENCWTSVLLAILNKESFGRKQLEKLLEEFKVSKEMKGLALRQLRFVFTDEIEQIYNSYNKLTEQSKADLALWFNDAAPISTAEQGLADKNDAAIERKNLTDKFRNLLNSDNNIFVFFLQFGKLCVELNATPENVFVLNLALSNQNKNISGVTNIKHFLFKKSPETEAAWQVMHLLIKWTKIVLSSIPRGDKCHERRWVRAEDLSQIAGKSLGEMLDTALSLQVSGLFVNKNDLLDFVLRMQFKVRT